MQRSGQANAHQTQSVNSKSNLNTLEFINLQIERAPDSGVQGSDCGPVPNANVNFGLKIIYHNFGR